MSDTFEEIALQQSILRKQWLQLHTLLLECVDIQYDNFQTSPKKSQLAHIMELVTNPLEQTSLQKKYHELIHSVRVLAHDLYGSKEIWHEMSSSAQTDSEQNMQLFPSAVERWIRTMIPSQITSERVITSEQGQKTLVPDEINAILWRACDTLRGAVDASEYKNYVLILLFLKYISDMWKDYNAKYEQLGNDNERIRRHMLSNRFVLPEGCDFESLYQQRDASNIGERINTALGEIENANPEKLKGVLTLIDFDSENLGRTEDKMCVYKIC